MHGGMPGSRSTVRTPKQAGIYLGSTTYTSTQTIVVPRFAKQGFVSLVGASGGVKSLNVGAAASGAGGELYKLLTGLVAGLTLALTIGAAGSTSPSSGGNSTLASGSQSIATLTANGSSSVSVNNTPSGGSGGTATGGDLNISGGYGFAESGALTARGGSNSFGFGVFTSGAGVAGQNYGGGAACTGNSSAAGAPGLCVIDWYT